MDKDNELYRQLIREKSEANLKYIGKSIEQFYVKEFDRIIEESENAEVPESLHNKLMLMLKEEQGKRRRQQRNRKLANIGKISAGFLAVVLLSGGVLMSTVEAVREKVFEIFYQENAGYIDFKHIEAPYDNNEIIPGDWDGFWYPGQLPNGFVLSSYTKNGQAIDLIFKNEKSEIILFSQAPTAELNLLVDNTESNPEKIEMNAVAALWTSIEGSNLLMWEKDGAFFILQSELSKDDAIMIAEFVIYLKK